jgi:hypothetical protein
MDAECAGYLAHGGHLLPRLELTRQCTQFEPLPLLRVASRTSRPPATFSAPQGYIVYPAYPSTRRAATYPHPQRVLRLPALGPRTRRACPSSTSFSGRSNYIWTSKARSVQYYETPTQGVGGNCPTRYRLKDDFAADNGKAVPGIRASPVRHHEGWLIVDLGKSG